MQRLRVDVCAQDVGVQLAQMPPLRERRADIPGLLRHLIAQRGMASGSNQPLTIDPEAEDMLIAFDWPGNVRQLENVLHRATILADGACIRLGDLPPEVSRAAPPSATAPLTEGQGQEVVGLRERVRRFEVSLIQRAIEDAGGDRRLAAQRLGIGLSSLYRKLEEFQAVAPH